MKGEEEVKKLSKTPPRRPPTKKTDFPSSHFPPFLIHSVPNPFSFFFPSHNYLGQHRRRRKRGQHVSLYCPKRRSKSSTSLRLRLLLVLQPPPTERGQTGRRGMAPLSETRERQKIKMTTEMLQVSVDEREKSLLFFADELQGKYR